jgi:hypothetical protein
MRSSAKWIALAVSLVLLNVLVPAVAFPAAQDAWMRLSRSVVPNASSVEDFTGKPVSFFSVGGSRWVSWSEQKRGEAAYHVMVLLPSASATENGRSAGSDGHRHTAARSWRLDDGSSAAEVRFEADYDALWQRVEIDGRRYSLSDGNVFVVRLAEGSRPSVTQIDTTLTDLHAGGALEGAVRSRLAGDEQVQRVLRSLHSYDDCEARKLALSAARGEKKS